MPDAVEQPTVPEEAIEAARRTREFRAGSAFDVPADAVEDFTRAVLAAALPVLLEELADALQASDIEKAGPGCCNWDFGSNVKNKAVRIVRGFADELTK